MSKVKRTNRKAEDADIIKLNSLGLSLGSIGQVLGVHPTTVTLRLKALGITPADTRRTFMEDVYSALSPAQQDWLAAQLGPHVSVKDFIKNVIVREYMKHAA